MPGPCSACRPLAQYVFLVAEGQVTNNFYSNLEPRNFCILVKKTV